jgi:hypothetical protein
MADDYDSAHSYYRANSSGGRRHRRATASAAGQAQAQEGADFALNEDLDYLASSAFEHFDINHILESVPIQYEQSGSVPEHPPLIRSSSKWNKLLIVYTFPANHPSRMAEWRNPKHQPHAYTACPERKHKHLKRTIVQHKHADLPYHAP